ncbi:MAG: GMC family oxidoreductase [Deltaproteobacteria bacterium]|nr:MAG: GMC family oxidoreductase [Deltaproteobacteria bacterium]
MVLADSSGELDRLERDGDDIDVIVIGSGYGAGVCAARLAEAGARVVVLERGREFGAAQRFPDTAQQIGDNVQIDSDLFSRRHRLGLYNFHINRDLDVLVGCGLGGTSLINANVAIKPDPRVLMQPMWPKKIREAAERKIRDAVDQEHPSLEAYFERARAVLDPAQYPDRPRIPRKLAAMLAQGGERCLVNVHFGEDETNSIGVPQRPCNGCGDCITGCNFFAKKTLCFTYLPIAKSYGAKIFVQCDVSHIERASDGRWIVRYQRLSDGDEPVAADRSLTARSVIVGAGVLGTAGILLRSKAQGLAISDELGGRFSGNGDALALAYNCDQRLDTVGFGNRVGDAPFARPAGLDEVGATILGLIDRRDGGKLDDGIIIEEGAFPSGLARLLRVLVQAVAGVTGSETQHGFAHWFHERLEEGRDLFGDSREGALNRSLLFLVMGHDGADGFIELSSDGRPVVRWPQLHTRSLFTAEDRLAKVIAGRLGGMFVSDPLNTPLLMNNLITVHPLGGCPMADDGINGVVDSAGRVFSDDGKTHPGLYVSDASVIPTSLGVNPLWTISALAEWIAENVARDLGRVPGMSTRLAPANHVPAWR